MWFIDKRTIFEPKTMVKQSINGILIFLGGVLLAYALIDENASVYIKIIGLVLLMFGAYRASQHWVKTKDDHLDSDES
ncbi:hypothetical protein JCM19294_1829 [Nonlabens tegetincola]|uniref:Uncharacterized protein n=2 Tax=Nonlabens tegetincola TaxID=323273 RepID=A0A090QLB9_9FLAO|nr:hypothetical protein [Nonlabens tegetincola]MEE2801827.1 hypothetical protein [Bacteroidota bacterium]GAK96316.1 hypothetical protein JCM19294_1829 [Nonlabens tegetincola]